MNFSVIRRLSVLMLFVLSSCRTWDPDQGLALDPVTKMTKKQIEENLVSAPLPLKKKTRPFIKKSAVPFIPHALKKPITLSTTESIPLKDVFFQIARQAKIDLSIDPEVKGGVALHATNRPLIDIVKELCILNRLRYKIENNILRIEPDKPYLINYNAQFLSLTRQNQSRISVATDFLPPTKDKAARQIMVPTPC